MFDFKLFYYLRSQIITIALKWGDFKLFIDERNLFYDLAYDALEHKMLYVIIYNRMYISI